MFLVTCYSLQELFHEIYYKQPMCQLLCAIQLQDKKIKDAGMLHVSCRKFRIGTVSPKQIGPARSPDSTTGVLVEDKAFKRFPCFDLSFRV